MSKTILERFHSFVESEYTAHDAEKAYRDILNETFSFPGPFSEMRPSDVMETMDETGFRVGVSDWMDAGDYVEINGEYYCHDDIESAKEEFISELERAGAEPDEIEAAESIEF